MENSNRLFAYLRFVFLSFFASLFPAYLKEPQATPLIPSTYNGSSNVIALIGQNPTLFVVSCVATALFLMLLIGIFLVTRGKRKHITELKKCVSVFALSFG